MIVEIERIKQTSDETIDYALTVFKIYTDKKVTLQNASELTTLLSALISGGALKIVINMKSMNTIDSAGIGILINCAKLIRKNKGDIVLCGVAPEINEVLNVVRLEKFVKIFATEVEAVNSFRYL